MLYINIETTSGMFWFSFEKEVPVVGERESKGERGGGRKRERKGKKGRERERKGERGRERGGNFEFELNIIRSIK